MNYFRLDFLLNYHKCCCCECSETTVEFYRFCNRWWRYITRVVQQVVLLARKLGDFFSFNISQFTLDENPIQLKLFRCKLYFVIALFEKKKIRDVVKRVSFWSKCPRNCRISRISSGRIQRGVSEFIDYRPH